VTRNCPKYLLDADAYNTSSEEEEDVDDEEEDVDDEC
jgi:hypothetical protein